MNDFVRQAELPRTTVLPSGHTVAPVWGWGDFCRRYRGECDAPASASREIRLDVDTYLALDAVNREVNEAVRPVTDREHWGKVDRWDLAEDGRGDCEDYVLLKRRRLIERGFPRSGLLVAVVVDQQGGGHAVLTARTDRGDLVLDNVRDRILPWPATGYVFLKRQSPDDQNRWVAIEDTVRVAAVGAAIPR